MTDYALQYTLVGIIVLGACVWLVVMLRRSRKSGGGCSGCSLKQTCDKAKQHQKCDKRPD